MARHQRTPLERPLSGPSQPVQPRPLRLLYLVFNRTGRGTYWRAFGFAQELARRGHALTLLSAAPQPADRFVEKRLSGVRLVQLPDLHRGSGYDPWHLWQRLRWLRRQKGDERYDLAHLFETRPVNVAPALYLKRRDDLPLFMDWCDWFGRGGSVEERTSPWLRAVLRPLETFFEERFRTKATGTTVINTVLKEKALALGVDPSSVLLLPNGANVDEIRPQDKRDVRRRLGLNPDRRYLAYTGSIFERDAQLMARAFDLLSQSRTDVSLLMIGYCNISLKSLVRAPENVVESGAVSYRQLADFVCAADVGWIPLTDSGANRGRFPMKAHDFIAAGRPLLVSDVGDLGAFVQQHGVGAVANDQAQAQARAALTLLQDEQKLQRLGQRARQFAEEERAWPVVSDLLERFYYQRLAQLSPSEAPL